VVTKACLPSRSNSRPAPNKLARFSARILHTKQVPALSGFGSRVPFGPSASRDVLVHSRASYMSLMAGQQVSAGLAVKPRSASQPRVTIVVRVRSLGPLRGDNVKSAASAWGEAQEGH